MQFIFFLAICPYLSKTMKTFFLTGLFIFTMLSSLYAQNQFELELNSNNEIVPVFHIPEIEQPLTPITLKQPTGLSAVYLIDDTNRTISSSYVPTSSFRFRHPANKQLNTVFTSGSQEFIPRDSYNPFGARTIEEAVVLGVVNTFFSKIMKNVQRK